MKLSLLYTNNEDLFPTIEFNDELNVVFAKVKDPSKSNRDSHNLGKTFLISVIDFCLLGKITKEHPFRKRPDLFGGLVFYLEMKTNANTYVTVRRPVDAGKKQIFITVDKEKQKKLHLDDDAWDYQKLAEKAGREKLDDLLDLVVIRPEYTYRKGLSYCLRRQDDYIDVFITSKFRNGNHIDWKPYVAMLLGFDHDLILSKYKKDAELSKRKTYRNNLQRDVGAKAQYDEIRGIIEAKQQELDGMLESLEQFDFGRIENSISESTVAQIESTISTLNQRKYKTEYDISELAKSTETQFMISVDDMIDVFKEAQIALPNLLVKNYQELEAFNREVSIERIKQLETLIAEKQVELGQIVSQLSELNHQRSEYLSILAEQETFKKYQKLQNEALNQERDISEWRQKLSSLDQVTAVNRQIENIEFEVSRLSNEIEDQIIRADIPRYSELKRTFVYFVQELTGVLAQIYVRQNEVGNPDFRTTVIEKESNIETRESEGTSYKKMLAVCYDLALLSTYSDESFYRFVYHDGVFEGLDNRKKVAFLNLIRRLCKEKGIQYILSVIDSDIPRDSQDKRLMFTDDEIIRQLHDNGKDGRLFRIEKF